MPFYPTHQGEASFLTPPEDFANIVEGARDFLQIIALLDPRVSRLDPDDEETFQKRVIPDMEPYMQNLAQDNQPKRKYLNAQGRLVWFNAKYPHGTIFPFIIEHDRDREFEKKVKKPKKNPRDANEKQEYETIIVKGWVHCGCIVWDGRGHFSIGEKTEDAEGFGDYVEKALTGAFGRAVLGLGIGTQFASDFKERYIVDAPVEEKETTATVASNGHSNGTTSVTPRTPATAALKGSAQVTTRAMIETKPVVDVQGIRVQIAALREPLSQPERFQITQYLTYLGIPLHQNEWKPAEYPQALQAMKDWLTPIEQAHPTKEQVERINGYANMMNKIHLKQTCARICGVDTSTKLNTTRMGYLLGVLAKGMMVYDLTNQVDPEFALIKSYGCASPFDLLYADREPNQKTWEDYCAALRERAQEQTVVITEPFLKKYEQEYAAFLKG